MSGTGPVVAIVDYGAGNLFGLARALERAGATVAVARSADDLPPGVPAVVVPGVGASGPAMRRLRRRGLDRALRGAVDGGAWYLGICLGMQLLFERSDEDGARGLAWLDGRVERLSGAPRLPHIGWNTIEPRVLHPLLAGMVAGAPAYFVHSYAPAPAVRTDVIAETQYGTRFASGIARGRVLGLQFHPEKSGRTGALLLRRFVAMVAGRADPAGQDDQAASASAAARDATPPPGTRRDTSTRGVTTRTVTARARPAVPAAGPGPQPAAAPAPR